MLMNPNVKSAGVGVASKPLMAAVTVALVILVAPVHVTAQDAMYKCTQTGGRIEYTNRPTPGNPNCTRLDIEPATVVPAPRAASSGAATPPAKASSTPTPPSFPRVDAAAQRARDSDRRLILEEELKSQEAKLAELQKVYRNGEPERMGDEARNYQRYLDRVERMKGEISRMQSDISSIRNELSKLR